MINLNAGERSNGQRTYQEGQSTAAYCLTKELRRNKREHGRIMGNKKWGNREQIGIE